jgi:MFS family permease
MYVYALNQLLIGLLVDRYGGGRVIAVGAVFFCLGSVLVPFSHSLTMLYISRALLGLVGLFGLPLGQLCARDRRPGPALVDQVVAWLRERRLLAVEGMLRIAACKCSKTFPAPPSK